MLVQVVYADGKMDEFEDNLIRRVCGLVYVENADVGPIKENIKKKLNINNFLNKKNLIIKWFERKFFKIPDANY